VDSEKNINSEPSIVDRMRDQRFVATHRGGPLTKGDHQQLIRWARECSEHVLPLVVQPIDARLIDALLVAKAWECERATVGEARKAALQAIAVANESTNPVVIAVARSIGHTVATAHMADHSIGAAEYALKAVRLTGGSIEMERKWQDERLTIEITDLIMTARLKKKLRI
jgi:hypothetical protein